MLEKLFHLSRFQTNWRTEMVAGITTYLTMAYVIFVNPALLAEAGMDHGAVFVATCVAAALGCFVMGFWANLPVALAPGMGLNAFRSEEHTSELQSRPHLVCRLLLEKKKAKIYISYTR